jgi:hypothetical protein
LKPLLVAGMLAAAAPAPPPPPCVSEGEVKDLVLFILPDMIDTIGQQCRASLATDSYLLGDGRRLARTLAVEKAAHLAGASAAFAKIGRGKGGADLRDEKVQLAFVESLRDEVMGKVSARTCIDVDQAALLLAPLPSDNLGRLAALLVRISTAGDNKRGKGASICQPVAR